MLVFVILACTAVQYAGVTCVHVFKWPLQSHGSWPAALISFDCKLSTKSIYKTLFNSVNNSPNSIFEVLNCVLTLQCFASDSSALGWQPPPVFNSNYLLAS